MEVKRKTMSLLLRIHNIVQEVMERTDGMEDVLDGNSMAAQLFAANEMEGISKNVEEEDVFEDTYGMAQQIIANELDGIAKCIAENNLGELGNRLWNLDSSNGRKRKGLLRNLNFSK